MLKEKKYKKVAVYAIKLAAGIAFICLLCRTFGFYYYRGNYMFPNLKDGDFVITYKLEDVMTNDVVLYKADGESRIGRVVAKEGDVVSFSDDGELLVNGSVSSEEIFYATVAPADTKITYPYTVPDGEVFILNDYRSGDSQSFKDSRTFEGIRKDNLKGKVTLLFRRRGF